MELIHATYDDAQWSFSIIDELNFHYDKLDDQLGCLILYILIQMMSYIFITMSAENNHELRYATNLAGSWVITTIDSFGEIGIRI